MPVPALSRLEIAVAATAFMVMLVGIRLIGPWLGQTWGEPALWAWALVGYPLAVIVTAGMVAVWVARRRRRREHVARDTQQTERVR